MLVQRGKLLIFTDARGKLGVVLEIFGVASKFTGVMASRGDQLGVGKIGDLEIELTVLHGAINLAWTADFKVDFGQVKAVGRLFHLAEATRGFAFACSE